MFAFAVKLDYVKRWRGDWDTGRREVEAVIFKYIKSVIVKQ